ncbi:MAG: hemerythrin domain-containing protein [Planctomycetales bacterium]|nr:hemerythrin domain-containing protein [Planctomycetales bacterium]
MTDNQSLDFVLAEHHVLTDLLGRVQSTLAGTAEGQSDLASLLAEASTHLEEHFRHEESSGFFERAVAKAPRLSDQAAALKAEHQEFSELFVEFCESTSQPLNAGAWEALRSDFAAFMERFKRHEGQENRMLVEVYDRDIGSKD